MIPIILIWLSALLHGGPDRPPCPKPEPVALTCEERLEICRDELGRAKICFTRYKACIKRDLGAR